MPELYKFDDFEKCFSLFGDKTLYCVAKAHIVPDESSEVLKIMREQFSDPKYFFKHDNLLRGVCLNECRNKVEEPGNISKSFSALGNSSQTERFVTFSEKRYFEKNQTFLINECINIELSNYYDLRAFTNIEYCIDSPRVQPSLGELNLFSDIAIFVYTANPDSHILLPVDQTSVFLFTAFQQYLSYVLFICSFFVKLL